jgi:hypothetical protein
MLYYEVVNLVTVTKMNIFNEMRCSYSTHETTAVSLQHQVSHRAA